MFFRILSFIGLIAVIIWIYSALKSNQEIKKSIGVWIKGQIQEIFFAFKNIKKTPPSDYFVIFRKTIYFLTILCVLILAFTGFLPVLFGSHLSGYLLLIHVSVAPIFAICMALISLIWANQKRFDRLNWEWFRKLFKKNRNQSNSVQFYNCTEKVFFWFLLILALIIILSILLSMLKYFGTGAQEFLIQLHRFSALFFVIASCYHTYLIIFQCIKEKSIK